MFNRWIVKNMRLQSSVCLGLSFSLQIQWVFVCFPSYMYQYLHLSGFFDTKYAIRLWMCLCMSMIIMCVCSLSALYLQTSRLCSRFSNDLHVCFFFFLFLQIFVACRVFWTKHLARVWTWLCSEWTETSVKFSPTFSPLWGLRSSTATETRYVEPSCCSALTEPTRSSNRSVLHSVQLIG